MTRQNEEYEIGEFHSKVMNKVISVKYDKQNYSRKYRLKGWCIIFYDKLSEYDSLAKIFIKDKRLKFHMYMLRGAVKCFKMHTCYVNKHHWHKSMECLTEQQVKDFIEEFKRAYKNKHLKEII